ncbi:Uncharacterised protein [Mycobacterium tuberculosis]|nr:Uncharacterised protein [Mycobacterium tuberculosis]
MKRRCRNGIDRRKCWMAMQVRVDGNQAIEGCRYESCECAGRDRLARSKAPILPHIGEVRGDQRYLSGAQ